MTVRGHISLEWRIPWPAEWEHDKKVKAAEKLASYMKDGTFVDVEKRRLPLANAAVQDDGPPESPYITFTLEV